MAEQATVAPEAESKAPEAETTVETTPEVKPEAPVVVEKTVSEMVEETTPEEKPNMVPESAFLGEKKARKAAEKEIAQLKKQIESGATAVEISDSVAEIAEEHDIDKNFLQKLVTAIKNDTEKDLEAKFGSKGKETEKQEKYDTVFQKALETALARTPEFKDIVNPAVIKDLAALPSNANKTLSQILEDTYGNAIQGKRTIETTTPGGGKDPEPLDYKRAKKDTEYFKQIMADPKKKAEYNDRMLKEGF